MAKGQKSVVKINDKDIEIRAPKVRDIRAVQHIDNDTERELKIAGALTGLTDEEIDDLDFSDYKKIQKVLHSFL